MAELTSTFPSEDSLTGTVVHDEITVIAQIANKECAIRISVPDIYHTNTLILQGSQRDCPLRRLFCDILFSWRDRVRRERCWWYPDPVMGLYDHYLLPKVVHFACGQKPARKQREKIVPLALGRVLEIGIGSGLNIPYYDTRRVDHLWGIDPSREMWSIARKNAREHHLDAEFIESGAESIPLDDHAADTVVVTYTLCTVADPHAVLQEVRRVLRPGGKLLFCEHGEAPDENVRRWQRRINPLWCRLAGGCNINRPIPRVLEESGLKSSDMQTMYIPGWKPASFNYWGTASYV